MVTSTTFTAAASRLAGLSGWLLGWRPGEFWAATPAELAAILDARGIPDAVTADPSDLRRLQEMFPDG